VNIEQYKEKIDKAMERAKADFSNNNLLALKIAIDKYLWKKLNGEAAASSPDKLKLYDLLEEIEPETSVKMLSMKMEFWRYKHPELEVVFDPEKRCILAGRWE